MTRDNMRRDAILLEMAVSAYRDRSPTGEIRFVPEWHDLTPDQRLDLFRMQTESRILERAADPEGLSSTAHAVLNRLDKVEQLG